MAHGKIYAIGGINGPGLATVEEYDPATNTWASMPSMSTARQGPAAVGLNGGIYAMGGSEGLHLATVELFDPGLLLYVHRKN